MQNAMVNSLKMNLLPHLAGTYSKLTNQFTRQCQQGNDGNCGCKAESVQASDALCTLRFKMKLLAEKE